MKTLPEIPIRARLAAWYGVFLAFAMAACGLVLYHVVQQQLLRHHDPALKFTARRVESVLSEHEDCANLTPQQIGELDLSGHLVLFHEVGGEGRIFYQSPESGSERIPRDQVRSLRGEERFETLPREGGPWRIYSKPYRSRAGRHGLIRIMEPMGDVEEPLEALKKTLFWITPLAGLFAAVGGYWLAARALRPVDQITRMAQTIGARQLNLRIPEPPVDDELGRLARTVNAMLGRLETSFETMGRFTSDASHELRSPLAVLRSTLDVTLARTRSVEEYQEVLMSLGEEVARLQSITEDLLLLARADSGRIPLTRRPVRLVELARETADSFGPQGEDGGLTLVAPVPVTISGDERWLRQLLLNLLENAFRHGKAPVVLAVEPKDDGALISVSDTGPGISPDKLDHVFERFYRTDAARTPGASEGAGLGLSISAWIVQAHGGRLTASNRPGGGGLFLVWLPLEGA